MQQAGNLINVLGQRSGHNLYLMDGVAITDEHFNNMVIAPSVDAIEEFNIEETSYAPEFGGKSGAVINVISKSGSNSFHGSLFEFVRNDIFDARNFFDSAAAPIPPFRQNQFGGSLGGPVRQKKTFFFLSYEGQRIRKSLTQKSTDCRLFSTDGIPLTVRYLAASKDLTRVSPSPNTPHASAARMSRSRSPSANFQELSIRRPFGNTSTKPVSSLRTVRWGLSVHERRE